MFCCPSSCCDLDLFWVTPPPQPRSSRPPICSAQSHGLRSARRGAPARSAAASLRCPEEVCFFAALDMEVGDLSEWARVDDVHGLDVVEVSIGSLPLLGGARPSYHPFSYHHLDRPTLPPSLPTRMRAMVSAATMARRRAAAAAAAGARRRRGPSRARSAAARAAGAAGAAATARRAASRWSSRRRASRGGAARWRT